MMHTSAKSRDGEIWVNHNSDWSGEAYVSWRDVDGKETTVTVPGRLFIELSRKASRELIAGRLIAFLEQM